MRFRPSTSLVPAVLVLLVLAPLLLAPLVLAPTVLALPADPETPSDEPEFEVYDTATVRARPLDTATQAVTVIDRPILEASGAATVADLLALVPGLDIVQSGTRGGLANVQIRGGDPNFTRVLIDGVAVNDPAYPVGSVFDFEALPASAVERIEIVRGALSSIYGSTGLAGTVHVITRGGPAARSLEGEAELGAGDADLAFGRLSLGGAGERSRWFVAAASEEESGRIADERFELRNAQGRLELGLSERSRLQVAGRFADWQADDYPDASGGPIFGDGALRASEHREAGLSLVLDIDGNEDGAGSGALERHHRLSASVYRHELDRNSPAIFPQVPESIENLRFVRSRLGVSTTLGRGSDPSAADHSRWRLGLGADVEEEDGRNSSLLRLPPFLGGDVPGDYDLVRRTPGVYAEGFVERGPWLLELGARVDWPEEGGSETSPRIGLAWRPGGGATRLRASWGRAFQLPSFFALASPPALGGNPELRPEVMVGGDLGIEHRFASGLRFEATYFDHLYEDLVDFDFQLFTHLNRSEVDARGVEMQLERGFSIPGARGPAWLLGWSLAVTWQEVEDRATGLELRHRPEWSGGLRLHLRPAERWRLDLDLRGRSQTRDEQIPVPERTTVDGRLLVGLRLLYQATDAWQVEARVDNLFDESYEEFIGFPGAGTRARLTLRYRFGAP